MFLPVQVKFIGSKAILQLDSAHTPDKSGMHFFPKSHRIDNNIFIKSDIEFDIQILFSNFLLIYYDIF